MSLTVIVMVSLSFRVPTPSSVTVMVTDGVEPPRPTAGVQLKAPVFGSILMPSAIEAASSAKVRLSPGSGSVAVAVKASVASSLID